MQAELIKDKTYFKNLLASSKNLRNQESTADPVRIKYYEVLTRFAEKGDTSTNTNSTTSKKQIDIFRKLSIISLKILIWFTFCISWRKQERRDPTRWSVGLFTQFLCASWRCSEELRTRYPKHPQSKSKHCIHRHNACDSRLQIQWIYAPDGGITQASQ